MPLKRISAALLLVFAALSVLLAACQTTPNPTQRAATSTSTAEVPGDGEQAGSTKTPPTPTRTATPPPTAIPTSLIDVLADDLDGTVIQYWHVWSGEPGRLTTSLVEEFNASNPWGIEVQATSIGSYDSLNEQMLVALQEGETPDLVVAFDHQASNWDENGDITVDLREYISDPVWGMSEQELADFYRMRPDIKTDRKLLAEIEFE